MIYDNGDVFALHPFDNDDDAINNDAVRIATLFLKIWKGEVNCIRAVEIRRVVNVIQSEINSGKPVDEVSAEFIEEINDGLLEAFFPMEAIVRRKTVELVVDYVSSI